MVSSTDPNIFTDANLPFDLNAYNEYGTTILKAGVTAKIIFQTGQLAGYTIEMCIRDSINNVSDAEKLILEKSQDVINSYMLKAKAAAYMQIAVEKYKESLQKQMDFESKTEIMSKGFLGAIRDGQLGERTSCLLYTSRCV